MATTRKIENRDLWSAIRGIGMYRMDRSELAALIEHHTNCENPNSKLFASCVIAEAARQVLFTKPRNS